MGENLVRQTKKRTKAKEVVDGGGSVLEKLEKMLERPVEKDMYEENILEF